MACLVELRVAWNCAWPTLASAAFQLSASHAVRQRLACNCLRLSVWAAR